MAITTAARTEMGEHNVAAGHRVARRRRFPLQLLLLIGLAVVEVGWVVFVLYVFLRFVVSLLPLHF